jgi:hypothetical protein
MPFVRGRFDRMALIGGKSALESPIRDHGARRALPHPAPNRERPVTVTFGTNRLVTPEGLGAAVDAALAGELRRPGEGPPLWDGHAGERIVGILAAVVGVPEAIA